MPRINIKLETWKKRLLDLGKRNRLINFKETKRSNITIVSPNFDELFESVVVNEKELRFPFAKKVEIDDDGEEFYDSVVEGDLVTKQTLGQLQKTLKVLRAKARMSIEEQGINTLYLAFGLLKWTESEVSKQVITSPIILVPVALSIESISSPYVLQLLEDEIIVNPTLAFKLENDCGLILPEFDSNENDIVSYLKSVRDIVEFNNWQVVEDVNLTLLSFLKINMFKDLERNEDRIRNNQIITAIAGASDPFSLPAEFNNFDHDKRTRPLDTFQVVDADSSQLDAILLSKNNVSFVLQGPPGTGKSQTITNIISEALADGKKVLFVSEKMAALQVVYKRLTQVGLNDFCLSLHSHKANKKAILKDLENSLKMDKTRVKDEALYQLNLLQNKRDKLNEYHTELHTVCQPLGKSIYEVNGKVASLDHVPEVIFEINNVEQTIPDELNDRKYLLDEFSKTVGKMSEDFSSNAWYKATVNSVTYELRHDIDANLKLLVPQLIELAKVYKDSTEVFELSMTPTINHIDDLIDILQLSGNSPRIPIQWITENNIIVLISQAEEFKSLIDEANLIIAKLASEYDEKLFEVNAIELKVVLSTKMVHISQLLNPISFCDGNKIMKDISFVLIETSSMLIALKLIQQNSTLLANELGIMANDIQLFEVNRCCDLLVYLSIGIKPTKKWFENKKNNDVSSLYQNSIHHKNIVDIEEFKLKNEILALKKLLLVDYDIRVLNLIADDSLKAIEVNSNKLLILLNTNKPYILSNYELILEKSTTIHSELMTSELVFKLLCTELGLILPKAKESTNSFEKLLNDIISDTKPVNVWFETTRKKEIEDFIKAAKSIQIEIDQLTLELLNDFDKEIIDIDFDAILKRYRTEYDSIFKVIKSNYNKDKTLIRSLMTSLDLKLSDKIIVDVLCKIKKVNEQKQWIFENKDKLSSFIGRYYSNGVILCDELDNSRNIFNSIQTYFGTNAIPNLLKSYLTNGENENSNVRIFDALKHISKLKSNGTMKRASALMNKDIENYEFSKIIQYLQKIIEATDMLKNHFDRFDNYALKEKKKDDLFKDINNIARIQKLDGLKERFKLNFTEDGLNLATHIEITDCESYIVSKNWVINNRVLVHDYFYKYLVEEYVDWKQVGKDIESFNLIIKYFDGSIFPHQLQLKLTNNEINIDNVKSILNTFLILNSEKILERSNTLFSQEFGMETYLSALISCLEDVMTNGNILKVNYETVESYTNKTDDYDTIVADISVLCRAQDIFSIIDSQKEDILQQFSFLWNGTTTDWNVILDSLVYAGQFKELVSVYNLPYHFIETICTDQNAISFAKKKAGELLTKRETIRTKHEWFDHLFEITENSTSTNLYALISRMDNCVNKKSQLEEWIDYRNNRELCNKAGLNDYIEKVETLLLSSDLITPTYLKRFYRLWLDTVTIRFNAVNSFRRKSHEENIQEFKELDNTQLIIARARVKERLLSHLPDFNSATSSRDEIGVLKRELNKQRKLLPLRKLFIAIPNLLTSLKPCFMMSPLSVSVFLEAQSYDFDIVVFDEASQVCTEDAIGAIMRGKQVIIVGDNKQLPPSNFFASAITDNDFDNDTDEETDDDGAYESILDEALNVLPFADLRWHYRSRHEHLIAFSNAKIYKHSLITFPSQNEKKDDLGVEYVYVSNGIYDRGGKKNNINEARKVADLVFEHFTKHPMRSLGVVTFSEAQQQTIDMAIRQRRLSDRRFDNFFSEEKEEPFFIKNLENVQGDERDTIIFSIGYAKDSKGTMYMNFGPLSREGGYRRLNVAITRAKFNVKLVGSIQPTDIDLDKVNSEGVKMLRSYIDFAKNGPSILENELKYTDTIDLESPFEESVYEFLESKGYIVATQVGCSGYRIDMAVRHPKQSGVFVLGIECDGATYHSSRTARERDRLRQTVLEDIGWKIYRVWSTDWVKDTITEGKRLIEAIEMALSSFNEPTLDFGYHKPSIKKQSVELNEAIEEQVTATDEENSGFGFAIYEEADIKNVDRISDDNSYVSNVIKYVVSIEQPIHFECLCKRIASLFGNQKATSKVRNYANFVMNRNLKDVIVRKDDFLCLCSLETIIVKIPKQDDIVRPINYISTEELAEAMISITNQSYGIKTDDLLIATARAFGFNRAGGNITLAMQTAYLFLQETGRITEIDDSKVVVL